MKMMNRVTLELKVDSDGTERWAVCRYSDDELLGSYTFPATMPDRAAAKFRDECEETRHLARTA